MSGELRAAAEAALEALVEADPLGRSGTIEKLRAALAEATVPSDCSDGHQPAAYIYEVRFTDRPDRKWRYYGLYRSKTQVESMLERTTDDEIEGRIVPLYRAKENT